MGRLLELHLSDYVSRKTQDYSITANVIVLFLLWVMKDVILICLMTTVPRFMWMASVSTSTLDLCYMFRYTSQFCRLTDFLVQVHLLAYQDLSLTLNVVMTGCNQINKCMQKYNWYVDLDK